MKYNKKAIKSIINNGPWYDSFPTYLEELGTRNDPFLRYFKNTSYRSYEFHVKYNNDIYKLSEMGFTLIKDYCGLYFLNHDKKVVIECGMPYELNLSGYSLLDYPKNIEIYFHHSTENKQFIEDLLHFLYKKVFIDDAKINNFYMIAQSPDGLYNQLAKFKNIPIKDDRYDLYYGKDFPHDKMLEFVSGETDNLMIIHGPPGCGKSNYIKNLITHSSRDVIYIPPSMLGMIATPDFITYMMENRGCILLVEDAEEILSVDRNSATANLLGMTDGFLKDCLDIKCICTLNCDIGDIDKALLRKGRLHYEHNFRKLTRDEGRELAAFIGSNLSITDDITLSEVFNTSATSVSDSFEERTIGFFQG